MQIYEGPAREHRFHTIIEKCCFQRQFLFPPLFQLCPIVLNTRHWQGTSTRLGSPAAPCHGDFPSEPSPTPVPFFLAFLSINATLHNFKPIYPAAAAAASCVLHFVNFTSLLVSFILHGNRELISFNAARACSLHSFPFKSVDVPIQPWRPAVWQGRITRGIAKEEEEERQSMGKTENGAIVSGGLMVPTYSPGNTLQVMNHLQGNPHISFQSVSYCSWTLRFH